jgi:hypothetical protein
MFIKIFNFFNKRRHRNRLHFILDISLSIIILLLLVVMVTINFYQPKYAIKNQINPITSQLETEISNPLDLKFITETSGINSESGVTLNFDYHNTGSHKIEELKITFDAISAGFSINKIQSILLENNTQIIDKNLIIKEIDPNQVGEGSIKIYINTPADPFLRQSAWQANTDFNYLNKNFNKDYSLEAIKFLSDTKIKASAYYHSPRGDQLGIGPIPPIVGIPTSYWLFFEVENLGNDLTDFLISGQLPEYVKLSDKQSLLAGNYTYNESNRRLIWQLPLISKYGGDYRAGFELIINPKEEHIGQVLNLINNLSYRFTDSLSNEEIRGTIHSLDTNLKDDFINNGQGTVLE